MGTPCSSKKVYGREGSKNGGKLVTLFMEGTWYDLIKNNLAMYIVVMKAQGQFSVVCPEMFYLFFCNSHLIRFKKQQICCTTLIHDEMIKGAIHLRRRQFLGGWGRRGKRLAKFADG